MPGRTLRARSSSELFVAESCGSRAASTAALSGGAPAKATAWLANVKRLNGEGRAALELLREALEADPADPALHFQLGETFRAMGQPDEAGASYRAALTLEGCPREAGTRLASLLLTMGQLEESRRLAEAALEDGPDDPTAHQLLGAIFLKSSDFEAAESCYRQALQYNPTSAVAYHGLGTTLFKLGRRDEAIRALEAAVALAPSSAGTHANLAEAYAAAGKCEKSLSAFRRAIELNPEGVSVHLSLGRFLLRSGWTDEALACFENARRLDPESAEVAAEMADGLSEAGRWSEAIEALDFALERRPDWPTAQLNRALLLLTTGQLRLGWERYRWRWKAEPRLERPEYLPPWDGRRTDRIVEVVGEQGLGTEVLFASCLPELIDDVGHCIVRCDARLVHLFSRSFPEATVREKTPAGPDGAANDAPGRGEEPSRADFVISTGDLPGLYRNSLNDFPCRSSYLVADASRRRRWRSRLDALGLDCKVGISWRGGATREEIVRRSVPLDQWAPLFSLPDIQWINVQYGTTRPLLHRLRQQFGIVVHSFDQLDATLDQDELAALLAELDLVICVSNSTAHLAAAVGTTVWAMLPFSPDWRWMLDRRDSPWHPTVELFRQPWPGDWSPVLANIYRALPGFVGPRELRAAA